MPPTADPAEGPAGGRAEGPPAGEDEGLPAGAGEGLPDRPRPPDEMSSADPPGGVGPRLWQAVLLCLAGSGLAAYAAGRRWAGEETGVGAAQGITGGAAVPWLSAVALVGLAGAGALLATRGVPRRLIGTLLLLVGAALIAASVRAFGIVDPKPAQTVWPLLCVVGGASVVAGGVLAAGWGHRWPGWSGRFERRAVPTGQPRGAGPVETRDAWDALDRGEDPTVS